MDNLYMKGELLQIYTKNAEIFEGRFYSITNDKSKISLYNVKDISEGFQNEGVCHYHNTEVTNVVKLNDPDKQAYLKMSQKEYENIIKMSMKAIFINHIDSQFHDAIKDIKSYNYVAVSTDTAILGRKCPMPVFAMSTPDQIYIFDTLVLYYDAYDSGLREILEAENPKKIVHDSRKLSDCLAHKHYVKLRSVFDTQVADIIITKNKTGQFPKKVKSLSECLNTYLGLNPDVIEEKVDIVECNKRPLPVEIKESIAKNIAYLHRLSEVINDELMLPFVRGVEYYVNSLRSYGDCKAWDSCGVQNHISEEFKNAIKY